MLHTHTRGRLEARTKTSRQHKVDTNVSCHAINKSRHITSGSCHTHTHMDARSRGAKLVENAELIQMCHVTQWMSHVTYEGVMCHTHTHTHTHGGLESRTKASRQHRVNMNVSCHTMDESRHMTNEARQTHTHG